MPTPKQISVIPGEAFIHGCQIVDNHNIIHKYVLDRGSREYKAPFNQIGHNRPVATPDQG